ncbi:hypothetical protein NKR23_g1673 [Pleurostoma richardsiae]|uniref:Uncharacterized protein n=1 Tax=Pleurostoma richardsiae TaxID=41990 RepID=A0AA38VVV8_9PEZI|nr:hypothetical protein NKR23_g1673 [Pleurostoma richardsiae]
MGAVFSAIGDCIMTVVNAIASVIMAIVNGIVAVIGAIVTFLTCGYCGRHRSTTTGTTGRSSYRWGRRRPVTSTI